MVRVQTQRDANLEHMLVTCEHERTVEVTTYTDLLHGVRADICVACGRRIETRVAQRGPADIAAAAREQVADLAEFHGLDLRDLPEPPPPHS